MKIFQNVFFFHAIVTTMDIARGAGRGWWPPFFGMSPPPLKIKNIDKK